MHASAWEWLRMTENVSYPWMGVGRSMQIYILRHAWEWVVTASDYLIMMKHVCDDTAWPYMGMYDIDSYSRWHDPLVVLQPLTGQVLHTRTQKCQHQVSQPPTCMTNVSEWLVLRGCAGHLKQIYMWRVEYCDTCGLTMHGNVWYWLIFKVT